MIDQPPTEHVAAYRGAIPLKSYLILDGCGHMDMIGSHYQEHGDHVFPFHPYTLSLDPTDYERIKAYGEHSIWQIIGADDQGSTVRLHLRRG